MKYVTLDVEGKKAHRAVFSTRSDGSYPIECSGESNRPKTRGAKSRMNGGGEQIQIGLRAKCTTGVVARYAGGGM